MELLVSSPEGKALEDKGFGIWWFNLFRMVVIDDFLSREEERDLISSSSGWSCRPLLIPSLPPLLQTFTWRWKQILLDLLVINQLSSTLKVSRRSLQSSQPSQSEETLSSQTEESVLLSKRGFRWVDYFESFPLEIRTSLWPTHSHLSPDLSFHRPMVRPQQSSISRRRSGSCSEGW